jgi:hypothetical protein
MMAVLVVLLILLVVTAAGVSGVDSRECGDWSSRATGPFGPGRDLD